MSAKLALTSPATLAWDARVHALRKPPHSGTIACPTPTWSLPGQLEPQLLEPQGPVRHSVGWCRSQSARLARESILPPGFPAAPLVGPKAHAVPQPMASGRTHQSLCGDSGTMIQVDRGNWGPRDPSAAQEPEVDIILGSAILVHYCS